MRLKKYILVPLLLIFFFSFSLFVHAQTSDEKLNQLNDEIAQYEKELTRLSSQANTLSNQIAQFNAQINLAQLKIEQTEEKIQLLGGRIDQLEVSLVSLSDAFSERAVETYKISRLDQPISLVLSSKSINDAVLRFNYLKKIQQSDRDLLIRLQKAQNIYQEEKTDQEDLHLELEEQRNALNVQKTAKSALLSQTKNDERRYQELLSQALAEKAAIEGALVSGVEVGPINQGDPIAMVGNSGYPGCSTGKHLHFEVRQGNSWVNPASYLQNKTVNDEQNGGTASIGSGSWPWPIQDTIRLTQYYGSTPYSWVYKYSGGIHTGFDMVSTASDVIRAPASGTLYKSSQKCGGSSIINIVYIDHGNDLLTFYLHVQ